MVISNLCSNAHIINTRKIRFEWPKKNDKVWFRTFSTLNVSKNNRILKIDFEMYSALSIKGKVGQGRNISNLGLGRVGSRPTPIRHFPFIENSL